MIRLTQSFKYSLKPYKGGTEKLKTDHMGTGLLFTLAGFGLAIPFWLLGMDTADSDPSGRGWLYSLPF